MNNEMYEIMKDKRGFIAALDQSGGSSSKTLKTYGIPETAYNTEEEMVKSRDTFIKNFETDFKNYVLYIDKNINIDNM